MFDVVCDLLLNPYRRIDDVSPPIDHKVRTNQNARTTYYIYLVLIIQVASRKKLVPSNIPQNLSRYLSLLRRGSVHQKEHNPQMNSANSWPFPELFDQGCSEKYCEHVVTFTLKLRKRKITIQAALTLNFLEFGSFGDTTRVLRTSSTCNSSGLQNRIIEIKLMI